MKPAFFSRLAFEGISKNKKLYIPYILSCVGMVAMLFIMNMLSLSPAIMELNHGMDLAFILSLGKFVIAVFAAIFLFYTNSFLTKKRYKEFGLYSILGMSKKNISRIVIWESTIVALIGLAGGITVGIVFSKLFELALLNMSRMEITYTFFFDPKAVYFALLVFVPIFILLMLKSIITVGHCKPIELMQSEHAGEKPLKANWVFALAGALILGTAYYMAVTIANPMEALTLFFIAVIMVIVATFLLFISGSVAFCKLLQKTKNYYYNKKHFVSVSSMAYRMKRNGAGLASICILVTMVLVMISSTGSLFFGADDAMRTRYPHDVELVFRMDDLDLMTDEHVSNIDAIIKKVEEENDFTPDGTYTFKYAEVSGLLDGSDFDPYVDYNTFLSNYSKLASIYFVSESDYNKEMNTDIHLNDGEIAALFKNMSYKKDKLSIGGIEFKVVSKLKEFPSISESDSLAFPCIMAVVSDYEQLREIYNFKDADERLLGLDYFYGYDYSADTIKTVEIFNKEIEALMANHEYFGGLKPGCLYDEREDFYSTFGGMFFLGIVLSIVFTFAAAVIIYYKQISEGYEDQKRFEIMTKVGMTDKEIKNTINSQILTVFYAPLVMAGIHLCFAFPFVWKILQAFNLRNLNYVIMINVISFVAFGLFYAIIYRATSRSYYTIVSKKAY